MKHLWQTTIVLLLLLSACTNTVNPAITPTGEPSPDVLPTPRIETTPMPDASQTVLDYLEKWNESDYTGMYAMLSPTSRDAVSEEDFSKAHTDAAVSLSLNGMDYGILTALVNANSAKVGYKVVFETVFFGSLVRQMEMELIASEGKWLIQWDSGLIMPELSGGKKLALSLTPPSRGVIYDNDGDVIASQTEAIAIGVVPNEIGEGQEGNLAAILAVMTGIPANIIRLLASPLTLTPRAITSMAEYLRR